MNLEKRVDYALNQLAKSIKVTHPIPTTNHTNYVVSGLLDTLVQRIHLGWCILGFIGGIYEVDLKIDSAIGEGAQARDNLMKILEKRLKVRQVLTTNQVERERDPLLQELIAHVLILVHQRKSILTEWLGKIETLKPPHLSANTPGIGLL